jgi:hypothetical protein
MGPRNEVHADLVKVLALLRVKGRRRRVRSQVRMFRWLEGQQCHAVIGRAAPNLRHQAQTNLTSDMFGLSISAGLGKGGRTHPTFEAAEGLNGAVAMRSALRPRPIACAAARSLVGRTLDGLPWRPVQVYEATPPIKGVAVAVGPVADSRSEAARNHSRSAVQVTRGRGSAPRRCTGSGPAHSCRAAERRHGRQRRRRPIRAMTTRAALGQGSCRRSWQRLPGCARRRVCCSLAPSSA